MLLRFTNGQASVALPWVLSGLHFYNQRERGVGGKRPSLSFLSRYHIPPPGRAGKFTFPPYMVGPGLSSYFEQSSQVSVQWESFILKSHLPINDRFLCAQSLFGGLLVNSGNWWWTGRLGVLQSMGSQRVRHDWATELNLMTPLGRLWALLSTIVLLFGEHCAKNMSYGPKNMFWGLLTHWVDWAGCRSLATIFFCLFVWGHVFCFCCMVLLLSKLALFYH